MLLGMRALKPGATVHNTCRSTCLALECLFLPVEGIRLVTNHYPNALVWTALPSSL